MTHNPVIKRDNKLKKSFCQLMKAKVMKLPAKYSKITYFLLKE
jgi:hypothetical protein